MIPSHNAWQDKNLTQEFITYNLIQIIFTKIMFSYIPEKIQTHARKYSKARKSRCSFVSAAS